MIETDLIVFITRNTFQHNIETPMQGHMASSRDVSTLGSMECCYLDDPNAEPL